MARILVIDDEEFLRTILCQVLQANGYAVDTAENGDVGLRFVQSNPVDLVITDLVMPEKEGIETIIELRRRHPRVKIIAMSGGSMPGITRGNLRCAELLGASRILMKPFGSEDLLAAVAAVLAAETDPARQ